MSFLTSTIRTPETRPCLWEFNWGGNVAAWAVTLTRFCVPKYLSCVSIVRNGKFILLRTSRPHLLYDRQKCHFFI